MNKEIMLPVPSLHNERTHTYRSSVRTQFKSFFLHCAPLLFLSSLYSRLLEMHVTPCQTLHLLHAQLAFYAMIFPFTMSLWVRFLLLAWFVWTVILCRRAGLR